MFEGIQHIIFDTDDEGYDLNAYLKVAETLKQFTHFCFLNSYAEILADGWLRKLVEPFDDPEVGLTGATASYESIPDTVGLSSKVVWMTAGKRIPYDKSLADAFRPDLEQHVPDWLAPEARARKKTKRSADAMADLAAEDEEEEVDADALIPLTRQGLLESDTDLAFAKHWDAITKDGAVFELFRDIPKFPNPHIRSNAFVIPRDLLMSFNVKLAPTKFACIHFESGPDSLSVLVARAGRKVLLVGADGRTFGVKDWPNSNTFRLGDQSNVLVSDNRVREFNEFSPEIRQHFLEVTWGEYKTRVSPLKIALGYKFEKGVLTLDGRYPPAVSQPKANAVSRPTTISVVIPTHNRLDLVKDAVFTILNQAYPHWECIVFDNASKEPVREFVRQVDDNRVRCVRSDDFLPVTDSWNRAIDQARNDYVLLIGDDDGVTPDCFSIVDHVVRHHNRPDFIYSSLIQFMHPGVAPWEPSGYVLNLRSGFFFDNRPDIFWLSHDTAQAAVSGSLAARRNFTFNMQAFYFERRFLESMRLDGKIFHSPFPDYYLANLAMGRGRRIMVSPKPISIAGVSRKSFGFTLFNNEPERGGAMLGTDLEDDPVYRRIKDRLLPGSRYNTNYIITMEHVRERLGEFAPSEVAFDRYRRQQILTVADPKDDDATGWRDTELGRDLLARLSKDELAFADRVDALRAQAVTKLPAKPDEKALAQLERLRSRASLYASAEESVFQERLDTGGFAVLPELFTALRTGELRP